jgi:hypothetical protein
VKSPRRESGSIPPVVPPRAPVNRFFSEFVPISL